MIITNSGNIGVKNNNNVVIDKIVFSDFDISKITDDEQVQINSVQGANTLTVVPTVALMANGHALVQATANASFNVNSAFVFARGNNGFLLAITESDGSLYEEVSIDAIRKLTFNAIVNDLVMASDVDSLVASAYAALPNGAPSYASDAYNSAVSYANSILSSDSNVASSYAEQAYTSAASYANSQVSTNTSTTNSAVNSLFSSTTSYISATSSQFSSLNAATQNNAVIDNHDGSITFNGEKLVIHGHIEPTSDLFQITEPGIWLADWGDQNTLKNFPSTNGAATIIALGINRNDNGLKLIVLDSWGGEFYTRWTADHYIAWEKVLDPSDYAAQITSLTTSLNGEITAKADSAAFSNYVNTVTSQFANKADAVQLANYVTNNSLSSATSSINNTIAAKANLTSLASYATQNEIVTDNHDGSITFNGYTLPLYGHINANTDLFSITTPGVWASEWGYQNTLKNFPSLNGAATIIALGINSSDNGLKIIVLDSWGGEYYTRWAADHYIPWEKIVDPSTYAAQLTSLTTSLTTTIASKADTGTLNSYATVANIDSALANKVDSTTLSSYVATDSADSKLANKVDISQLSNYATNSSLSSATSSISSAIANKVDATSLTSYAPQTEIVKDNHDGSITFNGYTLTLHGHIDASSDLFDITTPGVWLSEWGYQNTLKNFPSANGAATIIALGINRDDNGLKLIVLDSWGGEFYTRWTADHYIPWEKVVEPSAYAAQFASLTTSFSSQLSLKANTTDLNTLATQSSVDTVLANKADAAVLSSYATNESINTLSSSLASFVSLKANATDLSSTNTSLNTITSALTSKANTSDLIPFAKTSDVTTQLASKADVTTLSSYATNAALTDASSGIIVQLASYATQSSVNSVASSASSQFTLIGSSLASYATQSEVSSVTTSVSGDLNAIQSQFSSAVAGAVKDNQDDTIDVNGNKFSFNQTLAPDADIFQIRNPGIYHCEWGYQNTLKNFPSPNGAATVYVIASDGILAGMKITVIDSWGGEYYTHWNADHFIPWQLVVQPSDFVGQLSSLSSAVTSLTTNQSTVASMSTAMVSMQSAITSLTATQKEG